MWMEMTSRILTVPAVIDVVDRRPRRWFLDWRALTIGNKTGACGVNKGVRAMLNFLGGLPYMTATELYYFVPPPLPVRKIYTKETVYRVDICPRGNYPIYSPNLKTTLF